MSDKPNIDRRFPTLPEGMRQWLGIHDAIRMHGRDSFAPWLKEIETVTQEHIAAAQKLAKIEDIDQHYIDATDALGRARIEASAVVGEANEEARKTRTALAREIDEFQKEHSTSDTNLSLRERTLAEQEKTATVRLTSLDEREAEIRAVEVRNTAERDRLATMKSTLDDKMAAFEQAKSLLS